MLVVSFPSEFHFDVQPQHQGNHSRAVDLPLTGINLFIYSKQGLIEPCLTLN